jgi:hypothetical protein
MELAFPDSETLDARVQPRVLTMQAAIASSVRQSLCHWFPHNFYSLCHAFAVVGSNVASIVCNRNYRPVAGLAAIDAGNDQIIVMADEQAFHNPIGGAYHCWIESDDEDPLELVDFTFGHNHVYAEANGYPWGGDASPDYLWGLSSAISIRTPLSALRPGFGKDKIWVKEPAAGVQWMQRHMADNTNAYVQLTSEALVHYKHLTQE